MGTRGLLVRPPWIHLISSGSKTWELRSRNCRLRERVYLLEPRTHRVRGSVLIVGSFRIDKDLLVLHTQKHCVPPDHLTTLAQNWREVWVWEMQEPQPENKRYLHPRGAQTWVKNMQRLLF